MQFDRKTLIEIIEVVRPAVAKREIIPQQTHIMFLGQQIAATNGNIFITHPLVTDFSTSVKADDLHKILASSSSEHIELTVTDKAIGGKNTSILKITSHDTKASLSTVLDDKDKVEDLIKSLNSEMKDWMMLPEDFADALWLCGFSASKNMTDLIMTAVFIDGENVATTDRVRTSCHKMAGSVEKFLLSATDALELSNLTVSEYCLSENWAHFRTDNGATFSARRMKGEHLPLVSLFDMLTEDSVVYTLPSDFKTALESSYILLDNVKTDHTKTVSVKLTKGEIKCRADNERSYVEKMVKCDYDGSDVEFHVNPFFLSEILQKSTDMSIHKLKRSETMEFNVALFKSGNFKCMIQLPMLKR